MPWVRTVKPAFAIRRDLCHRNAITSRDSASAKHDLLAEHVTNARWGLHWWESTIYPADICTLFHSKAPSLYCQNISRLNAFNLNTIYAKKSKSTFNFRTVTGTLQRFALPVYATQSDRNRIHATHIQVFATANQESKDFIAMLANIYITDFL